MNKQLIKIIKTISAITLLICLFLPLSQCTQEAKPGQVDASVTTTVYTPIEASRYGQLSLKTIAPSLLFILPFALLLLQFIRDGMMMAVNKTSASFSWFTWLLEVISALALVFMLVGHAFVSTPLYGLYISAIAIGIYLLTLVMQAANRQ